MVGWRTCRLKRPASAASGGALCGLFWLGSSCPLLVTLRGTPRFRRPGAQGCSEQPSLGCTVGRAAVHAAAKRRQRQPV